MTTIIERDVSNESTGMSIATMVVALVVLLVIAGIAVYAIRMYAAAPPAAPVTGTINVQIPTTPAPAPSSKN